MQPPVIRAIAVPTVVGPAAVMFTNRKNSFTLYKPRSDRGGGGLTLERKVDSSPIAAVIGEEGLGHGRESEEKGVREEDSGCRLSG